MPDDTVLIRTAYFGNVGKDGDVRPLTIFTEEQLSFVRRAWLDEGDGSKGRPDSIILLDRVTVLINPRPNADESATGKKLHIGYVFSPAEITSDAQVPNLPEVYHDFLPRWFQSIAFIGKLKQSDLGYRMKAEVIADVKIIEPVVVKEINQQRFRWSRADDPELEESTGILFT